MKQNKPDGREAYITPSIEVIKIMKESLQQAANLTIPLRAPIRAAPLPIATIRHPAATWKT